MYLTIQNCRIFTDSSVINPISVFVGHVSGLGFIKGCQGSGKGQKEDSDEEHGGREHKIKVQFASFYLQYLQKQNMKCFQPQTHPQSFAQFYRAAKRVIENSIASPQSQVSTPLSSGRTTLLSQSQIDQYNLIQLRTFEITREIKMKLGRLTRQEVKTALIGMQNVLGELEKFCRDLQFDFLFQIFEKIAICLTMAASLGGEFQDGEGGQSKSPSRQLEKQQSKQRQKQISRQQICNKNQPILKLSEYRVKNGMGGVALYNENYKRHIENRQLLLSLNEIIREDEDRKQFWKEMNRDYRETVGICGREEGETERLKQIQQIEEAINDNALKFKQFGISLKNQSDQGTMGRPKARPKHSIIAEHSFLVSQLGQSTNASTMLCNSQLLAYEIESSNFSPETFQKALDQITATYQNQKYAALGVIRKIVERFWTLHGDQLTKFNRIADEYKAKCDQLEAKLVKKMENFRESGVQTMPCQRVEKLTLQCQHLKHEMTRLEYIVEDFQVAISRKNAQLMSLEKSSLQIKQKLQFRQKKCFEFQHRVANLQKAKAQLEKNIRMEIESHCVPHCDDERDLENIQQALGEVSGQLNLKEIDFITQRLINNKLSGESMFKGKRYLNKSRNIKFQEPENVHNSQPSENELIGPSKSHFKSQKFIRFGNTRKEEPSDAIKQDSFQPLPQRKNRKVIKFIASRPRIEHDSEKENQNEDKKNMNVSNSKSVSIFGDDRHEAEDAQIARETARDNLKLCCKEVDCSFSSVNSNRNTKGKLKRQKVFAKSSSSFYQQKLSPPKQRRAPRQKQPMSRQSPRRQQKPTAIHPLPPPIPQQQKQEFKIDGASFEKWDFGKDTSRNYANQVYPRLRSQKKNKTFNHSYNSYLSCYDIREEEEGEKMAGQPGKDDSMMEFELEHNDKKEKSIVENQDRAKRQGKPNTASNMERKLRKISNANARKYQDFSFDTDELRQGAPNTLNLSLTQGQFNNLSKDELNSSVLNPSQMYMLNYRAKNPRRGYNKACNRRFLNPSKINVALSEQK